jgi:hypothetical protein
MTLHSQRGQRVVPTKGLSRTTSPIREKRAAVSKSTQAPGLNVGSDSRSLSSLGWAKARAASVPMLASTAMTCMVGALLPPTPGLVLVTLGVVIAAALMVGGVEPFAVRMLYGGAPPTAADQRVLAPVLTVLCPQGLGPPLVRIWVRPGNASAGVTAAGRSSILVSRSLIGAISSGDLGVERAAALVAHAAGLVRGGATRGDLSIRFWTIPWVVMTHAMVGAARSFGVLPLVRVMWGARWLLTAVAAVQTVAESHAALTVLVVSIGATSYVWPRWVRVWHTQRRAVGDDAVARLRLALPPTGRTLGTGSAQGGAATPAGELTSAGRRHLSLVR